MRGDRGSGIASVLVVMAVLACIALALASSTTFHLRLANRQSQGEQARNLAESVLSMTKDRLLDQRDFGGGATTSDLDSVTVQFSSGAPSGRLTFHPALAQSLEMPVSVNNLEKDTSVVLSDGRTLPPFSAYLVARAEYGGVPKLMESVITIPFYKYAIATSGVIVSNGRLLVASIDSETDLSGGLSAIPADQLKAGHLAAQSTEQSVLDSVSPATGSLITGDVVSGGGVTLGAFTEVRGAVEQNHEPEDLPEVEVTDYDPNGWAGLETISAPSITNDGNPTQPLTLEGLWRRQGDLQVLGGLDLDGGYLYVDGDLQINGGVSGKGTIFCTGDISVGAASGFATDNVQAMVAGGSISISGGNGVADRNDSFFTGILFSKGGMNLSNVTVVGSVVNNSPEETTLELNNVALLARPDVLTFDFGMPVQRHVAIGYGFQSELNYYFAPTSEDFAQYFSAEDDEFLIPEESTVPLSLYRDEYTGNVPTYCGTFASAQEAYEWAVNEHGEPNSYENLAGLMPGMAQEFRELFIQSLNELNELYQRSKQESLTQGKFTLEPNQFIPFESRVRVVWSKELESE